MAPSIYWGEEPIWDSRTSTHSLIMDERGDVWFTSRVSKPDNPAFCQDGSINPSAQGVPAQNSRTGSRCLRSEDQRHQADPDLLQHPPRGAGGRCRQHVVDQRRRPAARRHRLGQPQGL